MATTGRARAEMSKNIQIV